MVNRSSKSVVCIAYFILARRKRKRPNFHGHRVSRHSSLWYISSRLWRTRHLERSRSLSHTMNPHRQILLTAIASRIVLLLAMSISCAIIPDFNAGDDVLQFDLRLSPQKDDGCFCLQGHACDPSSSLENRHRKRNHRICADVKSADGRSYLDGLYQFILPPVTKWDSARFLSLAVDPWARYPDWFPIEDLLHDKTPAEQDIVLFHSSEQSHAFLPFFPICIRYAANGLIFTLHPSILPSTYEATAALSAILINMIAFAIAAVSLYELTLHLMLGEELLAVSRSKSLQKKDQKAQPAKTFREDCKSISKIVAISFCCNPAGVFFTAAYSESTFAMLTFTGHAIAVKGRYYCYKAKTHPQDPSNQVMWSRWYFIPTNVLWALASYTRSNGVITTTAWWLLIGLGSACLHLGIVTTTSKRIVNCTVELLRHLMMGLIVCLPVLYHDVRGYNFHCAEQASLTPKWCEYSDNFSLYKYVQRKHWNVGLFRYYELKQLPNFILASPVLILSFWAAVRWIQQSLRRHNIALTGSLYGSVASICRWAVQALGISVVISSQGSLKVNTNHFTTPATTEKDALDLLLGSTFLPHYAILFGFAVIGTFLAHVQISTRLICSSCPAWYWFVVRLYTRNCTGLPMRHLLCFYFSLYNLLGVIMHVNSLPWT